jgi:hypothetical protein
VRQSAPELWTSIYSLLSLDANSLSQQSTATTKTSEDTNADDDAYEAEFWKDFNEDETPDQANDAEDMPSPRPWQQWSRSECREAIKWVVSTWSLW